MSEKSKKKVNTRSDIADKVQNLFSILNNPQTKCYFWKVNEPYAHLMGIRPVTRNTVEIVNENGFNPYEKKTEEKLFKCFKIFIDEEKNNINTNFNDPQEFSFRKEMSDNGIIYIKSHDINYIAERISKSW